MLTVACFYLATLATPLTTSEQALVHASLLRYVRLTEAKSKSLSWRPTKAQLDACRHAVASSSKPGLDRIGAYFALALGGIDCERNVTMLVKTAMAAPPGSSSDTDALETLPYALEIIYRKRSSPASLQAICMLRLDGGPAELLSEVRGDLFTTNRSELSAAWSKLSAEQRSDVALDIAITVNERYVRRVMKHSSGKIKTLASAVLGEEKNTGGD